MASLLASSAIAATPREVTIVDGAVTLHGTILLPDGDAKVPGVVLIAGSGPTDRDGNSHIRSQTLQNNSLKLLAEGLAARGIASLRYDKRGIGESKVVNLDESTLRFGTYVADAAKWAATLAADPRISRVVLIGHSEGALIATMAAEKATVAGVVSISGAGEPASAVLRRQFHAGAMPAALIAPAEATLDSLSAGKLVAAPPPELLVLFRPSVQPYLISWLPLDPAAELAKLNVPVLIVQGATDLQISKRDAGLLAAAKPDAKLVIVPGMNHVLKTAPLDRAANVATYSDPSLPLAPGLLDAVAGFVEATK
ncbi:alpha/beta hydrolase [Glacieibacterium megasporae]|uniref:alpha/beta hydrolase n=1 Tax=Glacieibacterium megasporae TaxID=2835787 RepID=UPI001C1E46C6|nr:alpha/beta hydrolase [Polymorphobacter megasporae]UAJ10011.1 alpha/beta fold hydrolase [Polymorphobacter megasporae]